MDSTAARNRTELWLPLLTRLTEKFPRWAVWKNVRSALEGHGDVDSFAPREDWGGIQDEFTAWASQKSLSPVIVCRHIPQGPHFLAMEEHSPYLVQLDVKDRATFRGCTLLNVPELQALSETDTRGFRRIRPGAEGVIKLLTNGMKRGGYRNEEGIATKGVVDLLHSDRDGMLAIASMFAGAEKPLVAGVDAVLEGGWDREAMRAVELYAYRKAIREPGVALSRVWFNHVTKKRCPVIKLIRENDRRVPDDREGWLASVLPGHSVSYPTNRTRANRA